MPSCENLEKESGMFMPVILMAQVTLMRCVTEQQPVGVDSLSEETKKITFCTNYVPILFSNISVLGKGA